jgi:hypothetical protein
MLAMDFPASHSTSKAPPTSAAATTNNTNSSFYQFYNTATNGMPATSSDYYPHAHSAHQHALPEQHLLSDGKRGRHQDESSPQSTYQQNQQHDAYQAQQGHVPQHQVFTAATSQDGNENDPDETCSKKRRHSNYIPPRQVPTTFTSVTGSVAGGTMKRNMSFSRIDPYVSYGQTAPLDGAGSRMELDQSSSNNHHHAAADGNRVRSMSF